MRFNVVLMKKPWRSVKHVLVHGKTKLIFGLASSFLAICLFLLWNTQSKNLKLLDDKIVILDKKIDNPINWKGTNNYKEHIDAAKDIISLHKDRIILENSIYSALIQAISGAFFFVTAYFTYLNIRTSEKKHLSERFTKAVEQLGSGNTAIIIGGICTLEQIFLDSRTYEKVILSILAEFIKFSSPNIKGNNSSIKPEVQSAVSTLARCLQLSTTHSSKEYIINLDNVNLKNSDLKGFNLSAVSLNDSDLSYASLKMTILNGASLENINFTASDLSYSKLNNCFISGGNFSSAILDHAELNSLNQINQTIDKVSFRDASLDHTCLNNSILINADFVRAKLSHSKIRNSNLYDANFSEAILSNADLQNSNLSLVKFNAAILENTIFKQADIYRSVFKGAKGLKNEQIKEGKNSSEAIIGSSIS